mmetsp:Transcript_1027/g.2837  ORF Transcript_1027/g.2837 Transcript_1027/m.2837 type:complete len:203 (+) Transcript_1027:169-777(+)
MSVSRLAPMCCSSASISSAVMSWPSAPSISGSCDTSMASGRPLSSSPCMRNCSKCCRRREICSGENTGSAGVGSALASAIMGSASAAAAAARFADTRVARAWRDTAMASASTPSGAVSVSCGMVKAPGAASARFQPGAASRYSPHLATSSTHSPSSTFPVLLKWNWPGPSFLSFSHCPSYLSPLASCSTPRPERSPSSHSPS